MCAIQLLLCAAVYRFNIPNPNIILFVFLSAVLVQCGYLVGTLCGILTLLYSMFFFSIDHSWIYFEPINRDKLIVVLLGLIANICVIGHLQQRNKNAIQEISKLEAEGKIAAARAQILHNMSHDIRTPINGILGMAHIIESNPADTAKVLENVEKIEKSASALLSLANNVLDMNEMQSGNIQMEKIPFRLVALCRETMENSRNLFPDNGLEFSFQVQAACEQELIGSPYHIKKILFNLYTNAIRYTQAGGLVATQITLLRETETQVVFQIKICDTGEGMSQEFIDTQLFEPFTQEKESARTKYQGSGLGMAIVKGLVDRMGGTITAESQLHKGSTFTLELPFEKPKVAAQQKKLASLSGVNILLADDNTLNLEIAEYMLTEAGAVVTKAENGKAALELFKNAPENSFDIILMDVMMPEMDGITAMLKIREETNLPVILLTAKSEDTDKILGLEVGADDYITKPFNPVEVIARVKSQLRRYMQLGSGQIKKDAIVIGGIELNDNSKQVTVDGELVSLTPTEYDILRLLMEHPGQVFSPRDIYKEVWKETPLGAEGSVAVHIRHLREKIEINPGEPRYIKVIWGRGYKMEYQ